MVNPTIEELQNPEKFELIAELDHEQIKEFVIEQLSRGGKMVTAYMIYQILMIIMGLFIITRTIYLAFQNTYEPLLYLLAGLAFCFSLLIIIHELLHGVAIKLTGAPKVNYGADLKKFIFYAEADKHVLNKRQFALIALAPLVVVKIITVAATILLFTHPAVFFVTLIMSAHSLFCAGDIGLLSVFYKYAEVFSYDVKEDKKSYYFRRK